MICRGFDFLPGSWNKAKRGIFVDRRAAALVVLGLMGLPSGVGKMDIVIEFKFLVMIDIKNIQLILTGQGAVGLTHDG